MPNEKVKSELIEVSEKLIAKEYQLKGKTGKPLRLFTVDQKPATDRDGCPLFDISGQSLCVFEPKEKLYVDDKGRTLTDSEYRQSFSDFFDPETTPKNEINLPPILKSDQTPFLLYDLSGHPLTDSQGRPTVSPNGNPLLVFDAAGCPLACFNGDPIFDQDCNPITDVSKFPILTKRGQNRYLFDCDGRPLTNHLAFPIIDVLGVTILVLDENLAHQTKYGKVYDADGIPNDDPRHNSTKVPKIRNKNSIIESKNGDVLLVFDKRGYPLTDSCGIARSDASGKLLIQEENIGKIVDFKGDPVQVFYKSHYNPTMFLSAANADEDIKRLFDEVGDPLTNIYGVPLRNAFGEVLIKFDPFGKPITDLNGNCLYDELGRKSTHTKFDPTTRFFIDCSKMQVAVRDIGVPLFNEAGMPVTDMCGFPLLNAARQLTVRFNKRGIPISNARGGRLFDSNGLPLLQSLNEPLINPIGMPIRLFNSAGLPLTDNEGKVLKHVCGKTLVTPNSIGQIVFDAKGGRLFDANRVSNKHPWLFDASATPDPSEHQEQNFIENSQPLYNDNGFPLTSEKGTPLVDFKGNRLIRVNAKIVQDQKGLPVFDAIGQRCQVKEHKSPQASNKDLNSSPLKEFNDPSQESRTQTSKKGSTWFFRKIIEQSTQPLDSSSSDEKSIITSSKTQKVMETRNIASDTAKTRGTRMRLRKVDNSVKKPGGQSLAIFQSAEVELSYPMQAGPCLNKCITSPNLKTVEVSACDSQWTSTLGARKQGLNEPLDFTEGLILSQSERFQSLSKEPSSSTKYRTTAFNELGERKEDNLSLHPSKVENKPV